MKNTLFLATLTALALAAPAHAQAPAPEIPFESNADLLQTPPNVFVGEVGGVGQNSKGQIFVYTRTGHPYATLGDNRTFARNGSRLFRFDRTGKFETELGQQVYGFNAAVGLRVDPQDNVWVIDQAANQVIKFDPAGNVALVLGRKPEAIQVRPRDPNAPPQGGGGGGQAPVPGQPPAPSPGPPGSGNPGSTFQRPTDVAWDKAGNIYVADFGNKRVQVFDGDGNFKSQITGVGTPLTLCITSGPTQYLYVSHSGDPQGMDDATIYKVKLDGTVAGRFGSAGKRPKEFSLANSIDCRNENELLVGEMANWRVQKLTLKPR